MSVILVTGGNRGLGYAMVQVLGLRIPDTTIIIGCRDASSGADAIDTLRKEGVAAPLDVVVLDIEDDESIAAALQTIDAKYGKLDGTCLIQTFRHRPQNLEFNIFFEVSVSISVSQLTRAVLVSNAARVQRPTSPTDRHAANTTYNSIITSNQILTATFLPLLRKSDNPRVIMVSSARGSLGRTASGELPPVSVVDYCVAKAGLNMLVLHLQMAEREQERKVRYWAVSPGHCRTAFNGFRGVKEPVEGAEVVVRVVEGGVREGFWEIEGCALREVAW